MTAPNSPSPETVDTDALLKLLRRKEGNWVAWADACQTLQKAGLSPQTIFENTGFEPIQQNQIVVAGQVYQSIEGGAVSQPVLDHFTNRGSDSLYELRILSKADRARAVQFIYDQGLDSEQVRDIAKALKEYSYRSSPPPEFTDHPGDAVAYSYWALARQQSDLQARSRLIAQGLRFAHSGSARAAIEKLLTDFAVVKTKPAPRLPLFRLETDADLPCLIPVAGQWPLHQGDLDAIAPLSPQEPFGIVQSPGQQSWVPIPGWQVILKAEDPIAILMKTAELPGAADSQSGSEPVLVVVDRGQTAWDDSSYFLIASGSNAALSIDWFETEQGAEQLTIAGRIIVIVRPKKVLDEEYTHELWQIDE